VIVLIVLLIFGLAAAAFVVVDKVTRGKAEEAIAANLQAQLGTPNPPSVDIRGRSFLTQAILAEFSEIQISASEVGADNDVLPIRSLDVGLYHVKAGANYTSFIAGQVNGVAVLDHSALPELSGRDDLTYAGNGRVKISVHTTLFGASVDAEVSGRVILDSSTQTLSLIEPKVTVAGVELPAEAAAALIKAVVRPVPITGVPYGLKVTALNIDDDKIAVNLAGEDVAFTR
jgi:hypothetical protein